MVVMKNQTLFSWCGFSQTWPWVIVACHLSSVVFNFTVFMCLGLRWSLNNVKKINVTVTVGIDSLAVLYSSGKTVNTFF